MVKKGNFEVRNCPAAYLKSVDSLYYYCYNTNMKCLEHNDCLIKRVIKKCLYQLDKPISHEVYNIGCKDMAKNLIEEFRIDWM